MKIKLFKAQLSNKVMETKKEPQNMSKEEEIGYHKGAINTLINERNELLKMVQIVEHLLQVHVKRLEELGVKLNQPKKE